jgi:hypothetical protein
MRTADASLAGAMLLALQPGLLPDPPAGQEVDNRDRPSLIARYRSHDQGMAVWAPMLGLVGTGAEGRPLEHSI